MTEAYTQLVDQLGAVKQSWRLRRLAEGLVIAVAGAAAALLVTTASDHLLHLGTLGRLIAALIFYGALGLGVFRAVQPMRVKHTDDYFAALVEQRSPGAGNRIINALQLGRDDQPAIARLVEAIVFQGQEAMDAVSPSQVVASRALKRGGIALGLVAIAWLLYGAFGGPAVAVSTTRVLLPFASISPFSYVQLSLKPDAPQRLLEGSPLTIQAATSDRTGAAPPDRATLQWTDALGRSRRFDMKPAGDGNFVHTFDSVDIGMSVVVSAGDAGSQPLVVAVDPRPRIDSMSAVVHLPVYTAMPDEAIKDFDGPLSALPGSTVDLSVKTTKDLQSLTMMVDAALVSFKQGADARTWSLSFPVDKPGSFRLMMHDTQGYDVEAPNTYTVALLRDEPPAVAITKPGRDLHLAPDAALNFEITAQDRYGLGAVRLLGKLSENGETKILHEWPGDQPKPQRQAAFNLPQTVGELGLKAGDHLQYWATAEDRNPGTKELPGPGKAQTRVYHLLIVSPQSAEKILNQQVGDYAKAIGEVLKLQRQNRSETAGMVAAAGLVTRQGIILRQTLRIADVMQQQAFPALTIIDDLRDLASGLMPKALAALEGYRDATELTAQKQFVDSAVPPQDQIIARLEAMLLRLDRNEQVAAKLKKMEKENPDAAKQIEAKLQALKSDLEKFVTDLKDLNEKYEKMPKRKGEEAKAEDLKDIADAEIRLDRYKQWSKDTVDNLSKLPDGFAKDSRLAESVQAIFEEIEKKKKGATTEVATPAEEGGVGQGKQVLEDLEMWMPDKGDSTRSVMEDPLGGKAKVPEAALPENLQDMVGDLIEDLKEFDEEADDITGASGANMQAGWDIADGNISSFGAVGKTGNQMPNNSELTGRSGAGRRGKSSGQSVGDENSAMEGRPTPARTTNEKYEEGNIKSSKQLDPRGATGGGKKTGAGQRGLQGGTPPDYSKEMERLENIQKLMREKAQQVARSTEASGKSSQRVNRALSLLESAEQDAKDRRYDDAARKRKTAIGELRGEQTNIDQAVELSLRKAPNLPADMRKQISAAATQALPEGYEDLVGEYYKALSTAGSDAAAPKK
jgi:hypothetical protein